MQFLSEDTVLLDAKATTAEEAIRLAGNLLVSTGKVRPSYIEAMIKGYRDIGPYIVLAPGIAAPHARPEDGALTKGLSLIRLQEPVKFGHPTNDPVRIVCALAGTDNTGHLEMLQYLASVLGDPDRVKGILTVKNFQEFSRLLEQ